MTYRDLPGAAVDKDEQRTVIKHMCITCRPVNERPQPINDVIY